MTVQPKGTATTLIVLLPGAYIAAADFAANGFQDLAAASRPSLELFAADFDLASIANADALAVLRNQILVPARQRGIGRIWLAGISLGGLLALCHCADTPGEIDGLCLLSPYPGSRLTARAIADAGGLAGWRPSAEQMRDPEFRVWHWLRQPPADLPVFIGYGRADRFADGMARLADCFPAADRQVVDGGHDWAVWRRSWHNFLASPVFTA
ncbi:MAG: alpha/beta fold hydrolase [Candidatus Accumulibacter sp.]|nr:alpha/beta fold hydrolase [Accumulibacter sp.]